MDASIRGTWCGAHTSVPEGLKSEFSRLQASGGEVSREIKARVVAWDSSRESGGSGSRDLERRVREQRRADRARGLVRPETGTRRGPRVSTSGGTFSIRANTCAWNQDSRASLRGHCRPGGTRRLRAAPDDPAAAAARPARPRSGSPRARACPASAYWRRSSGDALSLWDCYAALEFLFSNASPSFRGRGRVSLSLGQRL